MATKRKSTKSNKTKAAHEELETLRTEYRSVIGRAIIAGLLAPQVGGIGGGLLARTDYDQDSTGDYTQANGDHDQTQGDYNQGGIV